MKRHLILTIIVVIIGLFCSCNDLLDFQNDGRITMEEAFDSRVRVQGYLNSCYNYLRYPSINWASYSDEAEDSDKSSSSTFTNWYNGVATATTFASYSPDNLWSLYFQGI